MEQPNLEYIDSLAGDDLVFRAKLIATIQRELPLEVTAYIAHVQGGDYKLAAAAVHKLKHKISVLGLTEAYTFAERFEQEVLERQMQGDEHFRNILKMMTDFADEL